MARTPLVCELPMAPLRADEPLVYDTLVCAAHGALPVVVQVRAVLSTAWPMVRPPPDALKVAPTFLAAVMATVHVLNEPVHAPLQPAKVEPVAAAAVSVTLVPVAKEALQDAPQEMPAGELETVPFPVPDFVTARPW